VKRRKKLWIACVALAGVVALCALALLYRPVPYRFLEGSRYVKSEYWVDGGDEATYSFYRLHGTVDSVFERASAELSPQNGWQVIWREGEAEIGTGDKWLWIAPYWTTAEGTFPKEPGTVYVVVEVETRPLDRFLRWLDSR
jgi:hypothetical protein